MDSFLKTPEGFEITLKLIETINRSSEDYLFLWDINADKRWFFGDIDKYYDIRKDGNVTNSTPEMLKIIHPADSAAVLKSLKEISNGEKETHNMNYRWINRKGEQVWINCHGTVIRDNDNKPYLMLGRVSEENLRHLYNPLTGLWNKNKLGSDIDSYLACGEKYLMLLDIDGLSTINLTHGRKYGDNLLKECAEMFESLEVIDTAYHVDHNYFCLVLNVFSESDARNVFMKIKNTMADKCTFTAAAVPIDKTLFYDKTQLLDSVYVTLKKAKENSNNRIEFFSAEDLSHKVASLELLEELKKSIEDNFNCFELFYQPQIRAGNYDIYGVETLLRYNSKKRGRIFPDEFIPVLEESGLIKTVGLWVLKQALLQCKKWRESLPMLRVSVNFSVLQFEDPFLAEKVISQITESGLPGDALTIEITESLENHNSVQLTDTIRQLKQYNVNFAIDDFGTGYSNLSYLKQINIDEIKIDRVFVSGIEKETYNHRLINNVIEFAKSNDIRTCCEGVETARELVTLEPLLPDIIQGYFFDRPCSADTIENTYINSSATEYKERIKFINNIYEFKEKMGVVHFDPKSIMRENEVGLWRMRVSPEQSHCELHIDGTMEHLLALNVKYTPTECYDYWVSHIHKDYSEIVKQCLEKMVVSANAVQTEFVWCHPDGDVSARFSGKRTKDSDGMIVLQGYYRNIPTIDKKGVEQ